MNNTTQIKPLKAALIAINTTLEQTHTTTKRCDDYHFIYIVNGIKQIFFNENIISYTNGEIIYICDKTVFSYRNIPDNDNDYKEIDIRLTKPEIFSILNNFSLNHGLKMPTYDKTFGYKEKIISEVGDKEISWYFNSLLSFLESSSFENNEGEQIKLAELIYIIISSRKSFIANKLLYDIKYTENDIIGIVSNNIFSPVSISDLASMCGLSLFSFKREFKKATNTNPYNWILSQRLSHARFLLANTRRNIKSIAKECCFNADSHFTKLFKREFDATPSIYRQKVHKAIKEQNRSMTAKEENKNKQD